MFCRERGTASGGASAGGFDGTDGADPRMAHLETGSGRSPYAWRARAGERCAGGGWTADCGMMRRGKERVVCLASVEAASRTLATTHAGRRAMRLAWAGARACMR